MRSLHGVWLAVTLLSVPAGATVTKDQCIDANGEGQALRHDGKFAQARREFETCGDPSCPRIVRDDCAQRLKDLDRVQPTIVFDVRDSGGVVVSAARVSVDGRPLAERVDGAPLRVDPGQHTFTFSADGVQPVTRVLMVKEGETDRRESIALGPLTPPDSGEVPPTPLESARASRPGIGTRRLLGLTAGGVGVVGLAVGGIFGFVALSAANRQRTDCASEGACASRLNALSDHATAQTDGNASTVAFVAGGVLVAAGATLFFTSAGRTAAGVPSATSGRARPPRGWVVVPMVGPGGAGLTWNMDL